MNITRRKQLTKIWDKLEELKQEVTSLMDEEQEAFDNSPESIQEGERGTRMEEAIESLVEAEDYIQDAINSIEESMQ